MNATKDQAVRGALALMLAVAAARRTIAQEPAGAQEPRQATSAAAAGEQAGEPARRVVINIPAMTLEFFENDELQARYPVAVGRRVTPTPTGTFRVATQVKNPTWYGPNHQVVKPGPNNPVGTRWIGLDKQGYGIHGTNAPRSIGRAASHGCIRMHNRDVEELAARLRTGDPVSIIYETVASDGTALKDVYGLRTPARETTTAKRVVEAAAAAQTTGGN